MDIDKKDYFAGLAMVELMRQDSLIKGGVDPEVGMTYMEHVADWAYEYAEAMVKMREMRWREREDIRNLKKYRGTKG